MLEQLKDQPADKILSLMAAYRADPRPTKIDLGVGVYKDPTGLTPVMRAVRAAERRLVEEQVTKTYTALTGDPAFSDAMIAMVLDGAVARDRIAAAATPGGTGAIRQAVELVRLASPGAKVWLSNPTWPNHNSILKYLGVPTAEYRYFDEATRGLDFAGLLADLGQVAKGDVVLLHGCCHNPTGADLDMAQWKQVGALLVERSLFPMVDLAYQGLGFGLEEDAEPVRHLASIVPEMAVAASCSKNFAVYRDRVGAAFILASSAPAADIAGAKLATIGRGMWSMPPDHGAAAVSIVLADAGLRANWKAELDGMRERIQMLRSNLETELARLTNADFSFVTRQIGMFSCLPLSEGQAQRLRDDKGVYLLPDGRINIAGLNAHNTAPFAKAFAETR